MKLGTPVKIAALGNGFHISGTRFAIDRYESYDEDLEETFVHWRLLERRSSQRPIQYDVVCVNRFPLTIRIELISYHTTRDHFFPCEDAYRNTVNLLLDGSAEAVERIKQAVKESYHNNG
ncbi:hypothetical protein AB7309_04960 [Providencia manganoxydans]|uniref:Uncharacterized protein n=1 Tax=Providencia stuartii TaxID=588 RepID=A0AAI9D8H9_PROST|nr:hypothetical protein [Providencia stuartii]